MKLLFDHQSLFVIRYTAHDVVQHWEPINECANVSSTSCSVRALFKDDDDFRGFKRFRIDYITNGTEKCRGRKFQRDPLKSGRNDVKFIYRTINRSHVFIRGDLFAHFIHSHEHRALEVQNQN